ncbi:Transmembrane protein 222 [Anabarilius grahami]|uniref:Transmembrane protein 222 n=1 Tax=Anabarilius grahami TaxID=495550 RepID=A0A3N0XZ29_ANAGA|nr:Transmembrane protein 222 [Anabarilius grahami]
MADAVEIETMKNYNIAFERIDPSISRYPYCIVWTPIPVLSWLFPFIGHMGICTSTGVIRDFAGPYFVSEDNMAFGRPTKRDVMTQRRTAASSNFLWKPTSIMRIRKHYYKLTVGKWAKLPRLPEDLASILHLNQRHPGCCPVSKPAMTSQDQIEVGRLRVSGHKVQCPSGTHFFSLRGTPMNVNLKSSSSKRRGAQHQKSNAKPLCRRVETANTPWLQRLVVM